MAFPSSGFRWLNANLGVSAECFASPLNAWNERFCSVAYDTDRFFGSMGNFFCYHGDTEQPWRGGSFEANPPFVESVMEHMARRIELLLDIYHDADLPLSFTVIVPGWDDDGCVSYRIMSTSKHARPTSGYKLILPAKEHNYRPGMQQRSHHDEQPSNVATFVFFLQNASGAKKWPITEEKANELKDILFRESTMPTIKE